MKVFVLTSIDSCCDRSILGVFDSWEAVMHRMSWLGEYTDDRDEYHVECFEVKNSEETAMQAADVMHRRAEHKKERELIEANKEATHA